MTDEVRGFPAFPRMQRGARFARSWWGNAWIKAMEDTSLDQGRLSRGRTYARTGHVDAITVSPGRLSALVHGSDVEPYRTDVYVERLTDAEWDRFLDQVAARAGHIAALLDKDMPHDLVEAAEDAGVHLLPSVGDLDPECTCLDWGHPCKHAAALCYQTSWLLDADPFVLLLLRGRGERELLDELQRRNAALSAVPGDAGPAPAAGEPAAQAFAREPMPLPAPQPLPEVAEIGALPVPDARDLGVDAWGLSWLVADAAARARGVLAGRDESAGLDEARDAVRVAAAYPDPRLRARLAAAVGGEAELVRSAQAWRYGGADGLATLQTPWSPPTPELARARTALAAAWEDDDLPPARAWRNRWTFAGRGVQLRYGRDGRWYPYRDESGAWWPSGPPQHDPAAALADALGA